MQAYSPSKSFAWQQLGLETPESLLQACYFVAGCCCQASKESALMEIQQNQLVKKSGFPAQAAPTSQDTLDEMLVCITGLILALNLLIPIYIHLAGERDF